VEPAPAAAIRAGGNRAAAQTTLDWLRDANNRIITLADAEYPRPLLEIGDPPLILYLKGRAELLARPAVAIVGSRSATAQGLENAEAFARALSDAGITILSGLALGIDAAAHRGGLAGAGSSVAVVGTGLDVVYPARNRDLAHRLAEEGALLSEFPLGTPAMAANFPRRNRLISGLSLGVLVVEAAMRSGSLITARLAGEQGREVFAIPGSIHSPLAKGCHRLIKQGAKLVDSAQDILEELELPGSAATIVAAAAPRDARKAAILDAMGFDPCDIDTLVERTALPAEVLAGALLELELAGDVSTLPGGKYQRLR
jgi:DNA processing protein